ncbi:MAG: hypothetical protein WBY44_24990 [Bryobacteraceae bacterium]|jgi:hypothetical protein
MCENASDLDALRFEVYQSREAILIPADVKNDQPASLSQIGGRKGSLERFGMGPYGIFREDQKAGKRLSRIQLKAGAGFEAQR